ncbi:MAG TPA: glutamate--tRNA ligase [candidate division Zixibacteria bacterium]|nr:glutamate--tRNA ligase [candidate division Zixibacteria bacterium]MDD4918540.1 glutamate--tRNA ligase [candidate division Zixibacteria bacterium]MDM7971933.1 glutamate--tRNA ligase [candidate division Zixibacteria bacterium]HOD65600.1 glutamate--tRNA ligase [candidate division Zixibacteria bacterium]HOZ06869.1 glutamate--tRNA ligase [candidate division Zixibacteria bacterium]
MTDRSIRVRIAPSPTGYLHVGTARTAIFNWLFARHSGGKFLVRIEDTDQARSQADLIAPILDAMRWLGLQWDEAITYQSQRLDTYNACARRILELGRGYRCFCTPAELERGREEAKARKQPLRYDRRCLRLPPDEIARRVAAGMPYAIRILVPEGETRFHDLVLGDLGRHSDDIEDMVIARSDGSATYNLAVVVDDHEMGITHVIRGNDHVTNTFKQIHVYRALGWEIPQFGHLPLILRPDKKKVSKRLGDKDVNQYSREGILPEAMFNYLCLLGWNPKTDREIYTREELIALFTPAYFNASNAVFDEEKLEAFNREHLLRRSNHDLATMAAPLLVEAGLTTKYWLETRWKYLCEVVGLLKDRVRRVTDFAALGGYFFAFDYRYDAAAAAKHFHGGAADLLARLADQLEPLAELTADNCERAVEAAAAAAGVKKASVIHPTRLAISGMPAGPGLYEIMALLGRSAVLERLRKAIDYIHATPGAS